MKNKLFLSFMILAIPLLLSAQDTNISQVASKAQANKKVSFNSSKRDPFISKEESIKLKQMREEELRRQREAEEAARIAAEKERRELLRKQILCDEMKRHPSRIISQSVKLDGIMGSDAIINGKVVSKGGEIVVKLKDTEKAKVQEIVECGFDINNIKVKNSSVLLTYKGENFKVKM